MRFYLFICYLTLSIPWRFRPLPVGSLKFEVVAKSEQQSFIALNKSKSPLRMLSNITSSRRIVHLWRPELKIRKLLPNQSSKSKSPLRMLRNITSSRCIVGLKMVWNVTSNSTSITNNVLTWSRMPKHSCRRTHSHWITPFIKGNFRHRVPNRTDCFTCNIYH